MRSAASQAGFDGSISDLLAAAETNTDAAYQQIPGITDQAIRAVQAAVKEANAVSYQRVYEIAVVFGGLAILTALTTRDIDKKKKTSETAVQLENQSQPVHAAV